MGENKKDSFQNRLLKLIHYLKCINNSKYIKENNVTKDDIKTKNN